MDQIVCPACGQENPIALDHCENCSADLIVVKNILNNANRHYNSGLELAKQGRYEEAASELNSAIELYSHNPHFHNLLGTVYARRGLYDLAIQSWERTLALDDSFQKAHASIEKARKAELYLHQEQKERPLRRIINALGVGLGVALVLLIFFLVAAIQRGGRVNDLQEQLAAVRETSPDVQQLQEDLEEFRGNLVQARGKLESAEKEVARQQGRIETLEQEKTRLEKENRELARGLSGGTDDERVKQLASRLEKLEQEKENLSAELEQARKRAAQLGEQVTQARQARDIAQQEQGSLESQLKQARQEAETAKNRSREIQTGLANVYAYLNRESYDQALSLLEEQEESLPDVVVADLRQRAMEGKRRKEDPLYRARLEAERAEQQAQEEQERAYYAELKVEQAREALRQDRLEAARRYLQEALRIHPGDEAAEDLLAEVREKIEEEESRLREILRSAQLALGAGEYEEAMEGFQEYLNQRPGHETASAGLQAARQQQRLAAQRQQARRERIEQLSQQAPVAAEAGRVEEALNLYREWLQLEPDNRSVERSIERIESAEEDRLEEMSEEVAEGDAEMERGELERAIEAYQQALELARLPEEEQFVQRLLEQARGRYEKQQAEQQRRIEAYQEAMARAGELAGDGLFDAALEEANKALALFPDDRDARRMRRDLERALERQGE